MPTNINRRLLELQRMLDEAKIEVLLVTNLLNIRYLTGFSGSAGILLVGSSSTAKRELGILLTDGRYSEQAGIQIADSGAQIHIEIGNNEKAFEQARIFTKGKSSVAIEPATTTLTTYDAWTNALGRSISQSTVKIEEIRRFKDDSEIAAIAKACQIADQALQQVLPLLKNEPTEIEFAAELEFQMRLLGADGPSFETIVASGANSAMPHARPTTKKIVEGDAVVIDFGATWNGYHSDCTRTYFVGSSPTRQFSKIYGATLDAQRAGVSRALLEEKPSVIDQACRNLFKERNLAEFFTHSTGHGVGLEIHELPWITGNNESPLGAGDVITVEPGLYLPGEMGVRIEDTIAITPEGSKTLTGIEKSPIIA